MTQTQSSQISFVYNAFGKPDLSPEFANRLTLNLSHSAGLALIAIATASNVGVDLEYIRAQSGDADIARCFFSAAEVDYLIALPSHLYAESFFSCWTKKEAYLRVSRRDATDRPRTLRPAEQSGCRALTRVAVCASSLPKRPRFPGDIEQVITTPISG